MTHRRIVALWPVFAALLAWTLLLPAHAQDDPAPEADAPAEPAEPAEGDEAEGDEAEGSANPEEGAGEEAEEEPEITPGAETPKAAAEGFLQAAKEKSMPHMLALLRPSLREQFEERPEGEAMLKAVKVSSYELGEVTVDGTHATVQYKWKATFDLDIVVDVVVAAQLQEMKEQGLSAEELEMQAELLRELLREVLVEVKEHFERESHRMTLVLHEERWYVDRPIDLPAGFEDLFQE